MRGRIAADVTAGPYGWGVGVEEDERARRSAVMAASMRTFAQGRLPAAEVVDEVSGELVGAEDGAEDAAGDEEPGPDEPAVLD